MSTPSRFHERSGAIVVLVGAFALYLARLDSFGLWDGEIHTVFQAARPLSDFPAGFRAFAAHPPLWFIVTHLLLGAELPVWLLRFPAVLAGTASVAASYVLARQFLPRCWAVAVMWLVAISPISLRWSQSVRMYAAFMLLSTLSFVLALRVLEPRHRWAWLGFGLTTLLNLYTHYFAVFPAVAAGVMLSLNVLGLLRRKGLAVETARLVAQRTLSAVTLVAVGYLPWFLSVARNNFVLRQLAREEGSAPGAQGLGFFYLLFQDLTGGLSWVTPVLLLLACLGVLHLLKNRRRLHWLLILIGILLPVAAVVGVDPRRFHAKYLSYAVPLLAILLVSGIAELHRLALWLAGRFRRRGSLVASMLVAGVFAVVGGSNLVLDRTYFRDGAPFQESTEPNVWLQRVEWPAFMREVAQGDSGFIFTLCPQRASCTYLARQVAIHTWLSAGASQRLLAGDWSAQDDLDLWWVTEGSPVEASLNAADGGPVGRQVVAGLRHGLWRAQLRVDSAREILTNGSFEQSLTAAQPDELAAGWYLKRGRAGEAAVASHPTFDGSRALVFTAGGRALAVTSGQIAVQPGCLLRASMKVNRPILTVHDTIPRLTLDFQDADHQPVPSDLVTVYYLPRTVAEAAGWQELAMQALSPPGASYVVLGIESGSRGQQAGIGAVQSRGDIAVDDVHLIAIDWRPRD